MPRGDVELVFRARDEAKAAIEAVTQGLQEFAAVQESAQGASQDTDQSLKALGASIGDLQSRLGGLNIRDVLEKQVAGAAQAVGRIREELREARAAVKRYGDASGEAAADVQRLREQAAAAQKRLNEQAAVTDRAKNAVQALNAQNRQGRVDAQAYADQHRELFAVQTAEEARLKTLRQEFRDLDAQVRAAERNQNKLQGSLSGATAAVSAQEKALERAEAGYRELSGVAQRAEQSFRGLSGSDSPLRGPLNQAAEELRGRVDRLARSLRLKQRALRRLGAAMDRTENPSAKLVSAFETMRESVRRTRIEHQQQEGVLRRAEAAVRDAGDDLSGFAKAQEVVSQAVRESTQSLRAYNRELEGGRRGHSRVAARAVRQSRALNDVERAARSAGAAIGQQRRQASGLSAAFQEFLGGSRQSLSFFQRLRGEVLSTVAAYGGLFAAIQGVRSVLEAGQQIVGIQNRLAVVFGGDPRAVTVELDFLRRAANRLGIEFGVLAQEYSKFAVATQGTILAGQETRDIFIAVAEAARVQNLSIDQIEGTFLALTQIVSKGTVSMEELRRQLGDRLPGAIQIMAAALDKSVPELIQLVETGSLSSDVLAEFAEELGERFGPQLDASLESVSAALGRFQNQVFQTQVAIGEAGALRGLTDGFNRLSEVFASEDFGGVIETVAASVSLLARAVAALAENFNLLLGIAFVALFRRFTPVIRALLLAIRGLPAALAATSFAMVTTTRRLAFLAANGRKAAAAMIFLRRAFLGTTGLGLILGAVGFAVANMATTAELATRVMTRHRKVMDQVKDAYEGAEGSAEDFRQSLDAQIITAARASRAELARVVEQRALELREAGRALREALVAEESGGLTNPLVLGQVGPLGVVELRRAQEATEDAREAVRELDRQLADGSLTVKEANKELRALSDQYAAASPEIAGHIGALADAYVNFVRARGAAAENRTVIAALEGDRRAFVELGQAIAPVVDEEERLALLRLSFRTALDELGKGLPAIREEMERVREEDALGAQVRRLWEMAEAAEVSGAEIARMASRLRALRLEQEVLDGATDNVAATARLARRFDPALSVPDAAARAIEQTGALREAVGDDVFDALPAAAVAALSLVYDEMEMLGSGLERHLIERIREGFEQGSLEGVAEFLRQYQAGLTGGLRLSSFVENQTFDVDAEAERLQKLAAEREKAAQAEGAQADKRRASTEEFIAGLERELEYQSLRIAGLDEQVAVEEALRQLRERDPDASPEDVARVEAAVRAREYLNQLVTREQQLANDLAAAEEKVNDLLELRTLMQQELVLLQETGRNPERQAQLNELLAQMDDELRLALDEAISLAEVMVEMGLASETVVARLQAIRDGLSEAGNSARITKDQIEQAFAGSAVQAFDTFVNRLKEGRSVIGSLGAAFKQFAGQFLQEIARMIIRALALQAIMAALGQGGGGFLGALNRVVGGGGAAHSGGIIGPGGRPVHLPSVGNGGEYLMRLRRGEEVLTPDDPRHARNGGLGGVGDITIVNNTSAEIGDASIRQTDAGLEIQIDELVSNALENGNLTGATLAALGVRPVLEGR